MSRRIVIIGGTQAGPTAAARARELDEDADITIIQRGGALSFSFVGLHHHVSGEVPELSALDQEDARFFERNYNVRSRLFTRATAIDAAAQTVSVRGDDGASEVLPYDSLIFALGAKSLPVPGVAGKNVRALRTLQDAEAIVAARRAGARRAVVIGGGTFGLEATDGLSRAGFEVTLVEAGQHLWSRLSPQLGAVLLATASKMATVITGARVAAADVEDDIVRAVVLDNGRRIGCDVVVVCAGVAPRGELLAAAGVALGDGGVVPIDERAAVVGVNNIYAAGASVAVRDAVVGAPRLWAQAAIADKVAQVAGENAAGGDAKVGRFAGTTVVRFGGHGGDVVGHVGLSADEAAAAFGADDVDTSLVSGRSHDSFFPWSRPLTVEVYSQRKTGRVLGASAAGQGAERRLDVIATAVVAGLSIEQLAGLDLSAAAAVGPVRDVINTAATLALMEQKGLVRIISPAELEARDDWQIVDVRGSVGDDPGLPGAKQIPLKALRGRLSELDPSRPTVVHCNRGRSGFLAGRILKQRGFVDVNVVAGGLAAIRRLRPRP